MSVTNRASGRAFLNEPFMGKHARIVWSVWEYDNDSDRIGGRFHIADCNRVAEFELNATSRETYLEVLGMFDLLASAVDKVLADLIARGGQRWGSEVSHALGIESGGQVFLFPPNSNRSATCTWLVKDQDIEKLDGRLHIRVMDTRITLELHSRTEKQYNNVLYKLNTMLLEISDARRQYQSRGMNRWRTANEPA